MAQSIVDVHCHNILPFYVEALEKHDAALDEGFPLPAWDVDAHLKFMEEAGIGCSILTMPAPQPYFDDTEECQQTTRRLFNLPCATHGKQTIACGDAEADSMLVRISEIEIYPEYLDEYLSFALNVGAASVRNEPGVIAIYPMIQQRDSCQVRILEIYASQEAYKHHLTTEHFQTYKQGTLHMVKSLDLVDMKPMNPTAMPEIFLKMKRE